MPCRNYKQTRVLVVGGCVLVVAIVVVLVISSHKREDPNRDAILNTGTDGVCMILHCVRAERDKWKHRLDADNPTLTFQPDHTVKLRYEINGQLRSVSVGRGPDGKWGYANPSVPSQ